MQAPFAAGVDQTIRHQRLQHVSPVRSLARVWQSRRPEVIQPQLIPQLAGQPTRTPLARTAQAQTGEADMHDLAVQHRYRAIFREQRHLSELVAAFLERLDRPAPGRPMRVVDLAQIEHVPLHRTPASDPAVLDDAPGAVLLAVLATRFVAQKHGRGRLSKPPVVPQGARSAPHAVSADFAGSTVGFSRTCRSHWAPKFPESGSNSESRAICGGPAGCGASRTRLWW